jgi:O-antigen ligase
MLLALGVWMMLSGLTAVSRFDAWGGTVGMALSAWVTLGAVNKVMADRSMLGGQLLRGFLASSSISAAYGLVGFGLYLAGRGGVPRAQLPVGGCNLAGTVFAVAAVVALGCVGFAKRLERIALMVVVALTGGALAATQSRGAVVALGVGFIVLLMTGLRLRSGRALGVALLGLFAVFVTCAYMYPPLLARYESIFKPSANRDRLEVWRTAALMMRDRPILGVGVNNFHEVYLRYPHPERYGHQAMSTAHNVFMEFGASTGIPGLILLLCVVGLGIANGVKACGQAKNPRACVPAPRLGGAPAAESSGGTAPERAEEGDSVQHAHEEAAVRARRVSGVALAAFATVMAHLQFDMTLYSGDMLPLFFVIYGVLAYAGESAQDAFRRAASVRRVGGALNSR